MIPQGQGNYLIFCTSHSPGSPTASLMISFFNFKVVQCSPLKTGPLSITNPPSCKTGPVEYGTHCRVSCPPGYGLHEGGFYCSHDGQWQGMDAVCNGNVFR